MLLALMPMPGARVGSAGRLPRASLGAAAMPPRLSTAGRRWPGAARPHRRGVINRRFRHITHSCWRRRARRLTFIICLLEHFSFARLFALIDYFIAIASFII